MHYFIRNMVCNRCIMVVQQLYESMGYPPVHIELGEVETEHPLIEDDLRKMKTSLVGYGFEMIDDTTSVLIDKIKTVIIEMTHYTKEPVKENYSTNIESKLRRDYTYLSNLFSDVNGITIEKYIILQKIERVKELLVYDELTLSEIAYELGYSSVAHLSGQFKKVTGLTPGHFKQIKESKRKALDEV